MVLKTRRPKSRRCRAVVPPKTPGKNLFLAFSGFWWLQPFLDSGPHRCHLCFHLHMNICSAPLFYSLLPGSWEDVWVQAHLDNPKKSPHLQILNLMISAEMLFPNKVMFPRRYLWVAIFQSSTSRVTDTTVGQAFPEKFCQEICCYSPAKNLSMTPCCFSRTSLACSVRLLSTSASVSSLFWTHSFSFLT